MHRTDPGTGQHGKGRFGDHRKVEHDTVALAHAMCFQHVRHPANAFQKLCIRDVAGRGLGIIGFPDDRGLGAARGDMPVHAIGRDVQRAILEPLDGNAPQGEVGVLDLGRCVDPVDPLPLAGPECIRIGDRGLVHRVVFRAVDMSTGDEIWRCRVNQRCRCLFHLRSPPNGAQCSAPAYFHRSITVRKKSRKYL